jgi:hypothetical protein
MSYALSAIHDIVNHWFRRVRSIRPRPRASDSVPEVLPAGDLPTARYDPVLHTFTCPHCGQTSSVSHWTLIESGYQCYWSLDEPDEPDALVTAGNSEFSDDGDHATPELAHDSYDCYRSSLVPENFEWDWN